MNSRSHWLAVCGFGLLVACEGSRSPQRPNEGDEVPLPVISKDCSVAPNPPTDLTFTRAGSQVRGSWRPAPVGELPTWFAVEIGSGSGLRDLGTYMVPASRTELDGPMPQGSFFVRVYSRNGCGGSAASNEIEIVIP